MKLVRVEQPPEVEFITADEIFIKQMFIARAGTVIPQHSHKYAHTSMIAYGSVRLWKDGILVGDFDAPKPILITAGSKHTFMALKHGTVIYCIHNYARPDAVAVLEEHQIEGAENMSFIDTGALAPGGA